jgi:diguanylate cyclase (GGDEF)-like protein
MVSDGTLKTYLGTIHPGDRERFEQAAERAIRTSELCRVEYRIVRPGGEVHWLETQGQAYHDSTGHPVRLVGVTQDITERKRAEELIQQLAFFDPPTGLPNRNNLYDCLDKAIRNHNGIGKSVALLLLGLNQFKEINNTLGHHRGDVVLKEVGHRLRNVIPEPCVVARLGSDEFAILLPDITGAAGLGSVVQRIQKALHAPVMIERLPIAIEAGIGIALCPEHGTDPDTLLQRADIAMYAAKKAGTGHVIYDATCNQHSASRLSRMAELRIAIDQNELLLHYQPIINLKSATVYGTEALVRWLHPERGMIPPDEFIGAAERTGVIHPLTEWVIQAAMRQCAAWREIGLKLPISVNLSARNLLDPKLPDRIKTLIREHGIAPEGLAIEITESTIMTDTARAEEILLKLHDIGIKISIDDFGVGYSSLSYLRRLPVDRLKVDRSFVMNMTENASDAMIVRSTIELAHNLGLEVVAEGVETEAQYDRLVEWGCDAAQGYFMSRPLPADALTKWLHLPPWGIHGRGTSQQPLRALL